MKYLPFLNGQYSVAPGLQPLHKAPDVHDRKVFHIDDAYSAYIANKTKCRSEDIHKYHCTHNFLHSEQVLTNRFFVNQLVTELPHIFQLYCDNDCWQLHNQNTGLQINWHRDWIAVDDASYLSLFDALCCQVQEDVAVCKIENGLDWLATLHICSPNHLAPCEKVGKPFNEVHAPIPGMEKLNANYLKMLLAIVAKGPYSRFAWGISTDSFLNHHPDAPAAYDPAGWQGRRIADANKVFVRVERQTMTEIVSVPGFFFTIRTFFYPVTELSADERAALRAAVLSMTEESMKYKGLYGQVDKLLMFL